MNKFVSSPNLPENAKHFLLGKRYAPALKDALEALEIVPIFIDDNPDVDKRLGGHIDLSAVYSSEGKLFIAPSLKASSAICELCSLGIELNFLEIEQSCQYPHDAGLNVCLFGNRIIYNNSVSFHGLIEKGLQGIAVNQGYCRCSVCIVDENSIITSDCGIYSKTIADGIDTLLISPGSILLEGYDYGFIGGSSFKINRDKLAFTGTLDAHPDKKIILSFLKTHGVEPIFLTDYPIFDIGTAIPLTEK